jgi:hypothetical protein
MKRKLRIERMPVIAFVLLACTISTGCKGQEERRVFIVSAPPFYLLIPPGALPSDIDENDIQMEVLSQPDTVGVRINPSSLTYEPNKPALLFYRDPGATADIGTFEWIDEEDRSYTMPSLVVPQVGCFTFIPHHSEFHYARKTYTYKTTVEGNEVPVWELDVGDPSSGDCDYDYDTFAHTIDEYIRRILGDEATQYMPPALGVSRTFCEYQPAQVSISESGEPNWKVVTIKSHAPKLQQLTLVPSKQSWACIKDCSETEAEYLYNTFLNHELGHVRVDEAWERGEHGSTVIRGYPLEWPIYGGTDEEIKREAYMFWCLHNVLPEVRDYHKTYHESAEGEIDYSPVTCKCVLGTDVQDPDHPEINCAEGGCPRTYCPCDDPANGKPRNYSSESECAVECPSGLKCFGVQCTASPDCGE